MGCTLNIPERKREIQYKRSRTGMYHFTLGRGFFLSDIKFTHSGEFIVALCGAENDTIRIWNTRTGSLIEKVKCDCKYISNVICRQSEDVFLSFGFERNVKIWDIAKKCIMSTRYKSIECPNDQFSFDISGLYFVSHGRVGSIEIWSTLTGERIKKMSCNAGVSTGIAYDAKRNLLAISGPENEMSLWDTENKKRIWSFKGRETFRGGILFHPTKAIFYSCNEFSLKSWDIETGCFNTLSDHGALYISLNRSGSILAYSCGGSIALLNTETGQEFFFVLTEFDIECISLHPTKDILVFGTKQNYASLYKFSDPNTAEAFFVIHLCRRFRKESPFHFEKMPKEILRDILVLVDRNFFYFYPDFLKK